MSDNNIPDNLRLQDLLNSLPDDLAKSFEELFHQLMDVNKKLQSSESLKTHFLSNIRNEIYNPFTSIIGLSRNILNLGPEQWDKVRQMTYLIHKEASNLDFQLNNIFTAADAEAGNLQLESSKVDLKRFITEIVSPFNLKALESRNEIFLEFQGLLLENEVEFSTDKDKLRTILNNLIQNSLEFSHEGGKIYIFIYVKDEVLKITIKDQGIGISSEHHRVVFDRFIQLDSGTTKSHRGHGLGLSVVKELVAFLGGELELESEPDKGAAFTINVAASPLNSLDDQNYEFFLDEGTKF
jgi:signal transduction histidine kinase